MQQTKELNERISTYWSVPTSLVGTYRLREAGVRMMRILESLDIQLKFSSSDSSRIGNIGELLAACPTFIPAAPSNHIPPILPSITISSLMIDCDLKLVWQGWTVDSLHWRPMPMFYFTLCLRCQWLLPIYSMLPSNFMVMYTHNQQEKLLT